MANNERVDQAVDALHEVIGNELTAEAMIADLSRQSPVCEGELHVVGALFDENEKQTFFDWLQSEECREWRRRRENREA